MRELTTTEEIRELLAGAKVFAVLGANPKTEKPAHYVGKYLQDHGYKVLPVNAMHADKQIWGQQVVARLDELKQPVDIVDIFRRADALEGHLEEILAMDPRPRVVWLQEGIRNDAFAQKLIAEGIQVVQDRCPKRQHEKLF